MNRMTQTLMIVVYSFIFWIIVPVVAALFEPDTQRIEQIASWLPDKPQGTGRPITDRPAWEKRAGQTEWKKIIAGAEQL